jgi:hypothetical protein
MSTRCPGVNATWCPISSQSLIPTNSLSLAPLDRCHLWPKMFENVLCLVEDLVQRLYSPVQRSTPPGGRFLSIFIGAVRLSFFASWYWLEVEVW